jgi:predicted transcriptional regulator
MIKVIKRTTDNKFLQSIETDVWVDNFREAFEMTHRECELVKTNLLNTYTSEQIVEVVNMFKSKPMSKEEIKELRNLLKR